MDEYDVFLDEHARKVTLLELQNYALDNPQQRRRQFIIVTPNKLSSVTTNSEVRIHRMKPPLRDSSHGPRQTTL